MEFTIRTSAPPDEQANYVVQYFLLNKDGESVSDGAYNGQQRTFQVTGLSDGDYTIYATDQAGNPAQRAFTIACGTVSGPEPLVLTVSTTAGTITASLSGGTPPLTLSVPDFGPVPGYAKAVAAGELVTLNVQPGQWRVVGQDSANPPQLKQQTVTVGSAGSAPEPVPGSCNDPEADNYGSTENAGLCTFSPKLQLDALADLVALGRPVHVTLHSATIKWASPAPALATIHVGAPDAGQSVVVNGYTFVVSRVPQPGHFEDAETLADALRSTPELEAAYSISLTGPQEVQLVARRVGHRFTVVGSSTTTEIQVRSTTGQDATYSERREDWGLWLEVYALPGALYGAGQSKAGAQLAGRFESRYREDNAYRFDIADCLRGFTGLSYDASDRLTGYFLRYGEAFATTVGGYRRRRVVGETSVLFGLEAVEIMPAAKVVTPDPSTNPEGFPYALPFAFGGSSTGGGTTMVPGWRRLSRRPGRPTLPSGVLTTILNPLASGDLALDSSSRSATGLQSTYSVPNAVPAGRVTNLPGLSTGATIDAERVTVRLGGAVLLLAELEGPSGIVLSFINGQGGVESVSFEGAQEPAGKRTLNQYGTSTGQRTYSAELPDAWRYSTSLLSAEEWAWLRDELGNSPAVWLETETGPEPVNVVDFDASADVVKGDYTITVEVEFCEQPARGLTN